MSALALTLDLIFRMLEFCYDMNFGLLSFCVQFHFFFTSSVKFFSNSFLHLIFSGDKYNFQMTLPEDG